jgi:arginine:ornithine antiporter/lysine permease
MGFIIVTSLMVLVTLLPYAVLQRAEIAGMRQPSMAQVLEAVVGHWGAVFVSIGLLVSVLGAYLAWSLICAEVLFAAARTKDMPAVFSRENANKVPSVALWATNIVVQAIVITTYWSRDAFGLMLNLTSAMALIPFLLVAAYGWKLANRRETYDVRPAERRRDLIISIIATVYTIFLLYAGGLTFILLSAVLYAPGTALYIWARREQGKPVFTRPWDWALFGLAVIGAVVGIHGLVTGYIQI